MARQQHQARTLETPRTSGNTSSSAVIEFRPELAVQAIVFHLTDEGVAERVAEESIRATVVRLRRMSTRVSIQQWMWSEMTNAQRLEWLMDKTETASRLIDDQMCILVPNRP